MSTELLPGFEPTSVLLSLRPPYAELIADGTKTVELRRRFPGLASESLLILYATMPSGAVFGISRLKSIVVGSPATLWRKFARASAVTKQTFDAYYKGCSEGVAIELGAFSPLVQPLDLQAVRALWPGFSPPQSYRYVPVMVQRKIAALAQPAGQTRTRKTRANAAGRLPVSRGD